VYIYIKYKEQQLLLIFAVFHLSNSFSVHTRWASSNKQQQKSSCCVETRESETQAEEIETKTTTAKVK